MRAILQAFGGPEEDDDDHVTDRPGHDLCHAIEGGKLRQELGWQPTYDDFEAGLVAIVQWCQANEAWWRPFKGQTEAKCAAAGEAVTGSWRPRCSSRAATASWARRLPGRPTSSRTSRSPVVSTYGST